MCGCSFELRGYHLTVTHASLGFSSPTSSSLSRLSVPTHDLSGCYTPVRSSPSPSFCSRTLRTDASFARFGNIASSQCVFEKTLAHVRLYPHSNFAAIFACVIGVCCIVCSRLCCVSCSGVRFAARGGISSKVSWVKPLALLKFSSCRTRLHTIELGERNHAKTLLTLSCDHLPVLLNMCTFS